MKLTIERSTLRQAIESVSGAAATRTSLEVLTTIRVEAQDGTLRLGATDLDTFAEVSVPCEVNAPGGLCLPAKRLGDVARLIPDGSIKVEVANDAAKIRSGRASYNLNGLALDEFPTFPGIAFGDVHAIQAADLWTLVERVAFCASDQETRPIMCGVLWEVVGGEMTMVASNGHRIARNRVPVAVAAGVGGGGEPTLSTILRPQSLQVGRKLFGDDEEVEVALSDNYASLSSPRARLLTRLIEGPYPLYEQVIPKDNDKEVLAHRESLLTALRRVALIAPEQNRRVHFVLGDNTLSVSAKTPDAGDSADEVAVEYDGPGFSIDFNAGYLLDILAAVPTNAVRLTFKTPERAATIEPVGEDAPDLLYLVMPLRQHD